MPESASILICDDESVIINLMRIILEKAGYTVTATTNPREVYGIVDRQTFSAALIDYRMPEISGLELIEYIHEKRPGIPVLITTEKTQMGFADALKKGAFDYIAKPFEASELIRAVEIANEKYEMFAELKSFYEDQIVNRIREADKATTDDHIIRSITFDEDTYQAGVSILSYFSTVIQQKYPQKKIKVRIEQEGRKVRLVIQPPTGEKEEFEKTLEEFGLVVQGRMPIQELLTDPIQVMQLEYKLDMARMELSHTRQLLGFSKEFYERELTGMKEQLAHNDREIRALREQICEAFKRETESTRMFTKVIETYSVDGKAKDAILELSMRFAHTVAEKDKEIIFELLSTIKKQDPSAFEDIKAYAISSLGGASGNLLSSWLPAFFASLSK